MGYLDNRCYVLVRFKDGYMDGDIDSLKELLALAGVKMELTGLADNGFPQDGESVHVCFYFDRDAVKKKLTRGAGRHQKDSFNSLTMQQYKERIEMGDTVAEIAEYVGLSRATLYRRVKEAENLPGPDDCKYITY